MLEETGYSAARWRHLTTLYPCVGYSNERIEMFLAQDLKHEGHPGADGEFSGFAVDGGDVRVEGQGFLLAMSISSIL